MNVQYNEEQLQWEGVLSIQGQEAVLKICDDYNEAEIPPLLNQIEAKLNHLWDEVTFSAYHTFLNRVNSRRHFLKQALIDTDEYRAALTLKTIIVLEELAFKLIFDDQGLSHNHLVSVSVTSEGAVRAPEIDDWEEIRLIRGERVSVSLSNEFRPEQHESVIREIEAAINELWHDIESVLVSHLHELYNSKWREESEAEISQQEFLARMQLNGVHVMEDRAFDLYFLDNQLFNGRTVELFVDSDGSIYEPSLYGT